MNGTKLTVNSGRGTDSITSDEFNKLTAENAKQRLCSRGHGSRAPNGMCETPLE
ncbi:hypothetical protein ABT246_36880 [Streptomyces sp. NPDC001553]|uniref:hypothetical protein n=1 Tax=Streptomyces sp. NPDC001553 TaxID=3154385 RepID=UPI00331BC389